ncbi:MAG TPA: hypothetical protein P5169_07545 [Kiritimatiellia bacterium]|jgi:hypothetical protein|nr:hypothetical protein [Kiritimatiellia bacterium]
MKFEFLQRAKMRRTLWGKIKLFVWDFYSGWMAFFGIDAGEIPVSWRGREKA